ncbi:g9954 [Coccomyxa elongata]
MSQHSCESGPEEDFYSPLRCGAQYHKPDLPSAESSAAPDCTDENLPETAHDLQSWAKFNQKRKEATASRYWWQVDGLADASFPQNSATLRRRIQVTKQWSHVFDHIGSMEGKPGVRYLGRHLSADEAAKLRQQWQDRYPKVWHSDKGGNGRETPQQRASATASKKVRTAAWDDLLALEASERIPLPWHMRYRSDPYGNVVALDARGSSVSAFEVDHTFPWARGGLSLPANFMALFWRSNRIIKRDKIPTAMTSEELNSMQYGLSVDQFLAILALRDAQP